MPAHSFNQATFVGNLGRDPDLRYTPQGTAVCSFSMAVNNRKKVGEEWVDDTLWVKVQLWRNQAESAGQHLSKGSQVLVSGRIGVEEWTGQDGKPKFTIVMNADRFVSLGPKTQGDSPPRASKPPTQTAPATEPDISDDDIPF